MAIPKAMLPKNKAYVDGSGMALITTLLRPN